MPHILEETERYVQERGKPVPSKHHSILQMRIGALLLRDARYDIYSELLLDLDAWQPVPDISVYPAEPLDWLHDEVRVSEPPLVVVEIVSPSQNLTDLLEKAQQYLAHGVKASWIVQPQLCLITVLTQGNKPITYTHGSFIDPATGITISLDDIFR